MNFFEALVIGIIQGLTEFLPVSSSGHIELSKAMFGIDLMAKESLFFTLTLHLATALSTIIVFRKNISGLLIKMIQGDKESLGFASKIVVSMIPAGVMGFFLEDVIASVYHQNILLVGLMLLITALLLYLSDRIKTSTRALTHKKALMMGFSQAVAILPGISRSGATIATGIFLKSDRKSVTEFSFLMVVPIILGSMLHSILNASSFELTMEWMPILVGFFSSLIMGIVACIWMVRLVVLSQLKYFAIYCAVVGLWAMGYEIF
ncbi:MAG: undecaprenyl-diphosphate phosphatase [Flavobacteriaceae bacterium]|nr:undecaprenyl-diphosphate phosphatase [Flavobacteriaceae bacterium]